MSLRDYIRSFLSEDYSMTCSYGQEDCSSTQNIKKECDFLGEDIVGDNMQLAYYSLDQGDLVGAAWTEIKENKYNFVVVTTEDASDAIYRELIYDCMDEYSFLKSEFEDLELELKVFDDDMQNILENRFSLSVIKEEKDHLIMGIKK